MLSLTVFFFFSLYTRGMTGSSCQFHFHLTFCLKTNTVCKMLQVAAYYLSEIVTQDNKITTYPVCFTLDFILKWLDAMKICNTSPHPTPQPSMSFQKTSLPRSRERRELCFCMHSVWVFQTILPDICLFMSSTHHTDIIISRGQLVL